MKQSMKGSTLKRCIGQCIWQLNEIITLAAMSDIDDAESDIEKIDAILKATEHIERHCDNIRGYVQEYDEY